jgi:D-alanyl-D-alanine carboxypeptidase
MRNHNHLLGSIEGVDGIKTGFTRASGFNVVTSVHRDGRYLVAVVMGGRSSLERDAHMRELIGAQIKETAFKRVMPAIAKSNQRDETQPASANASVTSQGNPNDTIQPLSVNAIIFPPAPAQSAPLAPVPVLGHVADNAPQPSAQVAARWLLPEPPADAPMSAPAATVIEKSTLSLSRGGDPTISSQPRLVKTITIHTRPVQSASLAPMPQAAPVAAMTPQPSAQVAERLLPSVPPAHQSDNVVASAGQTPIAQTSAALAISEHAKFNPEKIEATKILAGERVELAKVETVSAAVKSHIAAPHAPASSQNAWLVQIGAFDHEDEARQHLSTARLKARDALVAGHALTERVQRGDKVLYRARFTGFDKETAEGACRQLRRSDMNCIAVKN